MLLILAAMRLAFVRISNPLLSEPSIDEDHPDSTVKPNENDARTESDGCGVPVPGISPSGTAVGGDGQGDGLTSKCY